jgi:trigger factor
MLVEANQTDPCTIELNITVDEAQVTRTFESVLREFSRYVNVPGFRPGKAPRHLMERYVNMERVRERAMEKLIQDTYPKAVEQEGIQPYRQASVQPADLEDKKPYTYKVLVPLEPQVVLGPYTGLTVERPVYTVTDQMISGRIDRFREQKARMENVTDRGLEKGDIAIVENQITIGGQVVADSSRRTLLTVDGAFPQLDDAVLGMMPGDERTFEVTYPDDYVEQERRGQTATYVLKVIRISAKRLPQLSDELAVEIARENNLKGVEGVDGLKAALRTRMEEELKNFSDQIAEQRLIEKILDGSDIYFPEALPREEVENEINRIDAHLRARNMSWDSYLKNIGQTAEEFQNEKFAEASSRIRIVLALRELSIEEGLQATDAEVEAEFQRLLESGTLTEDQYEEFRADVNRRIQVANALIQQRLHDFLFANNTFTEVEESVEPSLEELTEANE